MIRLNERGNGIATSQQEYLADAEAMSKMAGSRRQIGSELAADMAVTTLWLITQGHARNVYRRASL